MEVFEKNTVSVVEELDGFSVLCKGVRIAHYCKHGGCFVNGRMTRFFGDAKEAAIDFAELLAA